MWPNSYARAMTAVLLLIFAESTGHTQTPRKVKIIASRFSYTPDEIVLKKGEPVVLVLRSVDVTHGLMVPELKIKAEIKKGKDTEVRLTPSVMGTFAGKCANFCGQGHALMTLQIKVVE
jgi:cytochrome c oxidase subunit II